MTRRRPLLLDLFCKAGGAARGYHDAGFEVVGVDHEPQPRYPYEFIQADVLDVLRWPAFLRSFDAVHASPPCQPFTCLKSIFDSTKYADLVVPVRRALEASGVAFVIENVVGAPLRRDLVLCASAFGLRAYRHRIFECSFPVDQPYHPKHKTKVNRKKTNRRGHWDAGGYATVVGDIGSYVGPEAMGIDWMTGNELSQAIPPAYTRFIGVQLRQFLERRVACQEDGDTHRHPAK